MTKAEIKAQLPIVKVNVNGVVMRGLITGRYHDYPTVKVSFRSDAKCPSFQSWEFSWEAIERAINTNTALIV